MINKYMAEAIKQAMRAAKNGDVPVGAVIVKDHQIIARGYNKREKTKNALNHAEIVAIKKACAKVNDWRLNGCDLYVTLEPCPMCLAAAEQARIDKIVYGTPNKNDDNLSTIDIKQVEDSDISKKSAEILKKFFQSMRK